jgi:hypothetical protein
MGGRANPAVKRACLGAKGAWKINNYAYNGGADLGFKAAPNNFAVMST